MKREVIWVSLLLCVSLVWCQNSIVYSNVSQAVFHHPTSMSIVGNQVLIGQFQNNTIAFDYTTNASSTSGYLSAVSITSSSLSVVPTDFPTEMKAYTDQGVPYLWVGFQSGYFRRYVGPFTNNMQYTTPITQRFGFPHKVTVDLTNQVLYAADGGWNRVLKYSLDNLTQPIMIYGQDLLNQTAPNRGGAASATSLYEPWEVVLGCAGDLFIIDQYNHRILHYPNATTKTADYVIGQPNMTSRASSPALGRLSYPSGLVLNANCSTMWVADTVNDRVLKFDEPFFTGQFPSEVLSNISSSTTPELYYPRALFIDPRTGFLWISDCNNDRILVGSSPGILNTADFCEPTSVPRQCYRNEALYIGPDGFDFNALSYSYTTLFANESIILDDQSKLTISTEQSIQTPRIKFGGQLNLVLSPAAIQNLKQSNTVTVTVVTYDENKKRAFEGQFTGVEVQNSDEVDCGVDTNSEYGSRNMQVLLTKKNCDQNALSPGAIAGIAVGGVMFVLLLIVIVVVVVIVAVALVRHHKRKANKLPGVVF